MQMHINQSINQSIGQSINQSIISTDHQMSIANSRSWTSITLIRIHLCPINLSYIPLKKRSIPMMHCQCQQSPTANSRLTACKDTMTSSPATQFQLTSIAMIEKWNRPILYLLSATFWTVGYQNTVLLFSIDFIGLTALLSIDGMNSMSVRCITGSAISLLTDS